MINLVFLHIDLNIKSIFGSDKPHTTRFCLMSSSWRGIKLLSDRFYHARCRGWPYFRLLLSAKPITISFYLIYPFRHITSHLLFVVGWISTCPGLVAVVAVVALWLSFIAFVVIITIVISSLLWIVTVLKVVWILSRRLYQANFIKQISLSKFYHWADFIGQTPCIRFNFCSPECGNSGFIWWGITREFWPGLD